MPSPNQQFHIKLMGEDTGLAASITGTYITVPDGLSSPLATWVEISPLVYVTPLTLSEGEYIASIVVPWDTDIVRLPFTVETTALDINDLLLSPEMLTVSKYLGIRTGV